MAQEAEDTDPDSLADLDAFLHNMVVRNQRYIRELMLLRTSADAPGSGAPARGPAEESHHFSSRYVGPDGRSLRADASAATPSGAIPRAAASPAALGDQAAGGAAAAQKDPAGGSGDLLAEMMRAASADDEVLAREMIALSEPSMAGAMMKEAGVQEHFDAGALDGDSPEAVVLERGLLGDPASAGKVDRFFFAGDRCRELQLEGESYKLVWREEVGERVVAHLASPERGLVMDSTSGFVFVACFDLPPESDPPASANAGSESAGARKQAAEIAKMLVTGLGDYLVESGL